MSSVIKLLPCTYFIAGRCPHEGDHSLPNGETVGHYIPSDANLPVCKWSTCNSRKVAGCHLITRPDGSKKVVFHPELVKPVERKFPKMEKPSFPSGFTKITNPPCVYHWNNCCSSKKNIHEIKCAKPFTVEHWHPSESCEVGCKFCKNIPLCPYEICKKSLSPLNTHPYTFADGVAMVYHAVKVDETEFEDVEPEEPKAEVFKPEETKVEETKVEVSKPQTDIDWNNVCWGDL